MEDLKDYSKKLEREMILMNARANTVKADTQILVYEIQNFLRIKALDKVEELLEEINEINKLEILEKIKK
mgnify:FL=1|tara:strand:- start:34 stop:243 length:210 start_codon:yes stop_codon:yes gene_type:complete